MLRSIARDVTFVGKLAASIVVALIMLASGEHATSTMAAASLVEGLQTAGSPESVTPAQNAAQAAAQTDVPVGRQCADLIAAFEAQWRDADVNKPVDPNAVQPTPNGVAVRLLEIIRARPEDPSGCDPLCWIVLHCRVDQTFTEAVELLVKHHAVGPNAERLPYALAKAKMPADEVLRAIVDSGPRAARGEAYLVLSRRYRRRASIVKDLQDDPQMRQRQELASGKEFIAAYMTQNPEKLLAESDRLLEQAERCGRSEIAVGKPAPEIVGEDTTGKVMRLSDFRGRVVVISFWGTWCGPCMALVPDERELVNRYAEQPFVILGVNTDSDKGRLADVLAREGISWRSWWDGGSTYGPIASAWDVFVWPTVFVLDAKGIIRFKYQGTPHPGRLREAVDDLLDELRPKS